MSWSASVPATDPADFSEAVDSCVVAPEESSLAPEPKKQLAAAREVVKSLASDLMSDGKKIAASLSGHACTEGVEGLDSIGVSVTQSQA